MLFISESGHPTGPPRFARQTHYTCCKLLGARIYTHSFLSAPYLVTELLQWPHIWSPNSYGGQNRHFPPREFPVPHEGITSRHRVKGGQRGFSSFLLD